MKAIILEHPTTPGRFLVCRCTPQGWATAEVDCPSASAAHRERLSLQRRLDDDAIVVAPPGERPLIAGFYTNDDAA